MAAAMPALKKHCSHDALVLPIAAVTTAAATFNEVT